MATATRFDNLTRLAALRPNRRTLLRSFVGIGLAAILPLSAKAQDVCDPKTDPLCTEDEDINTKNEGLRLDLGVNPGENGCPSLAEVRAAVKEDDIKHISGCLFGKTSFGDPFVITLDENYLFTLDHGSENLLVPGNGKKAKTENVSIWGRMAFADVCTWKSHESFYAREHDISIVPYDADDFATCGADNDDGDSVDIDTTGGTDTGTPDNKAANDESEFTDCGDIVSLDKAGEILGAPGRWENLGTDSGIRKLKLTKGDTVDLTYPGTGSFDTYLGAGMTQNVNADEATYNCPAV